MQEENDPDLGLFTIKAINCVHTDAIKLDIKLNGAPVCMELDTGASVSLVSERVWREKLKAVQLEPPSLRLRTYTGEPLKLLGQAHVQVAYENQSASLPILVASGDGPSLFGRNWLNSIRLNWGEIKKIRCGLDDLMGKYAEVFRDELGMVQDYTVKLTLKQNAKPKFFRPRAVPYAIKGTIEKDLDRLEKLGVITKVSQSEWAAPIVAVPKADGSVRICGDYKVTINPELEIDHYPLPTPEDLFATLAGGKAFSKLDLSHAYQQVLLDPECRKYVTINTHRGLYQYNRLPFGVASAPAVFQQLMEIVFQGAKGVVCYLDDILVTGASEQEHLQNLEEVLRRLKQWGFRLKKAKCYLLQPSVEYLGFKVDADGLLKSGSYLKFTPTYRCTTVTVIFRTGPLLWPLCS